MMTDLARAIAVAAAWFALLNAVDFAASAYLGS